MQHDDDYITAILATMPENADWRRGKTCIGDEKNSRHQIFVTDVNHIGDTDFSRHRRPLIGDAFLNYPLHL